MRGYLLVEKCPHELSLPAAANPRYRGLYRTLPIRPDLLADDAIDPMQFSNENALIPSLAIATGLLDQLCRVTEFGAVELIYVQTTPVEPPEANPARFEFAGYDLACEAPFWSPVADPPVDDTIRAILRDKVNSYGLFRERRDAENFLRLFQESFLVEADSLVIHCWEVRLVGMA